MDPETGQPCPGTFSHHHGPRLAGKVRSTPTIRPPAWCGPPPGIQVSQLVRLATQPPRRLSYTPAETKSVALDVAVPSLSIIVTHRGGDELRERNLATVIRHIGHMAGMELIVVEQDAYSRLEIGGRNKSVRSCFVYNPGPFNKSWGLNVGARMARAPILLMLDGDILLEIGAIEAAVEACRQGVNAVNPYADLIDLSPDDSEDMCSARRGLDWIPGHRGNRSWAKENICFCGGAYVIDASFYREIGGQDERFEGWGGEDDAMSVKIVQLARRVMTLANARAYHLYHPRRSDDVYRTKLYLRNKALVETYRAMSVDRLRCFSESWRDRIGDPNKYDEL